MDSQSIPNKWLIYLFGSILAVSPILRFSWDYQTQTILGLLIILSFVYLLNNYKFSFDLVRDGLFILFFVATLIPCHKVKELSLYRDELLFLLGCFIFSFVFGHLPSEKKKGLLKIPVFIGVWFCVILLAHFFRDPEKYVLGTAVPSEIIVNLNIIAGYLTLCFGLSLIFWNDENKNYRLLPVIIFISIILSKSRIAIFSASVIVVVFSYSFYKSYFRLVKLLLVLIIVILSFLTFLKMHQYRLSDNLYLSDRLIWWHTAINIIAQNLIAGVGWGGFGNIYLNYRALPGLNTLYAHNLALQLLAETGLIGFSLFIVLLFKVFKKSTEYVKGLDNEFYLPILSGITAFLFINLFDYSFYVHSTLMLFWVCFGILYFKESRMTKREKSFLPVSLFMALNFIIAVVFLKPFAGYMFFRNGVNVFNEQKYEQAEGKLLLAVELDPEASRYYNELAKICYFEFTRNKNKVYLNNAIEAEKQAIEHSKTNAAYWSDLGWLYWTDNQNKYASDSMLKAIKYDRFNPKYQNNLRNFLNFTGHAK
ncbi:MAG: O-antigen ligase family protein [Elusimicrobia bacterium]|nr:O-antigen ligase family protein [Candidatus Liberimonas magnetica]